MKSFGCHFTVFFAVSMSLQGCLGQDSTPIVYKDPDTGIVFDTWTASDKVTNGGLTLGLALPSDALKTDATEFIGYIQCSSTNTTNTGWCGLSLGGTMTNSLLLMAYPYNQTILTSFRYTADYARPDVYTGNATLTQISSHVNSSHYTLIYRCQSCLSWTEGDQTGKTSTSAGSFGLGWAQSIAAPKNRNCPDNIVFREHDSMSIFVANLSSEVASPSYSSWAALATKTVTAGKAIAFSQTVEEVTSIYIHAWETLSSDAKAHQKQDKREEYANGEMFHRMHDEILMGNGFQAQ
ncbi:Cellobiose dehydrogenase [Talaromyces islandicus]|uniref:Cellobiose dehydrogenase n=1 Tax=Talaromyces islandicus TaxID=28573 RepID=A0A0U1MBX4_TALIS|nr:Cellobiose dehydrogenase [Talaromyces islandicus]